MLAPSPGTHACEPNLRFAYVLDDEREVGAFVCQALATNGFVARQFCSSSPFLAELKANPPGLIVLDLALGQSDAVEIIRHLKAQNYRGEVLLISGRDEATLVETKQIGERYGLAMLPTLRKPFRVNDLKDRLGTEADLENARPAAKSTKVVAIDLGRALRNNWLELWYKPKINLKSRAVCGAQALLLGKHPEHGVLFPATLLPPAGDPLHQSLSRFVIQRAMADWGRFADARMPLKLSVALSTPVLRAPDFISVLRELLPKDPNFPGLTIDVSEDDFFRHPEWFHEIATQLKLYNVRISIETSGAASSTLSRLISLPGVELKLDRNSSLNCSSDHLKGALCQVVVNLAHRFGVLVCAEGVENVQDLQALINMGCDRAQGALIGEPMNPEQFAMMLHTRALTSTLIQKAAGPDCKPRLIRTV